MLSGIKLTNLWALKVNLYFARKIVSDCSAKIPRDFELIVCIENYSKQVLRRVKMRSVGEDDTVWMVDTSCKLRLSYILEFFASVSYHNVRNSAVLMTYSESKCSDRINSYNPLPLNLVISNTWSNPVRSRFVHTFLWHDSGVQTSVKRDAHSSPIPHHTSPEQRRLVSSPDLYPPWFKPFTVQSGTSIFSVSVPLFYFIEWMNYRMNYMKVNVIFAVVWTT